MDDELRDLIREIITKGHLRANLVMLEYEVDSNTSLSGEEILERVSLVYEKTSFIENEEEKET